MTKSEKFSAPAIHTAKSEPVKKAYYFENRVMKGQPLECTMGSIPKKGVETESDTITRLNVRDGEVVELTEEQYQNLRTRGIQKPVIEVGSNNERRDTGERRLQRNYILEPV